MKWTQSDITASAALQRNILSNDIHDIICGANLIQYVV